MNMKDSACAPLPSWISVFKYNYPCIMSQPLFVVVLLCGKKNKKNKAIIIIMSQP